MAKAISKHVWGRLMWENGVQENGRLALLLINPKPKTESDASLWLRFAFVTVGVEQHLFPSFLIDDWGGEVRSRALYRWVQDNGNQFPRAEVFGFEQNGASVQYFVRELELYAKLPCYVYPSRQTPLADGLLLDAILLPEPTISQPEKTKRPSQLKRPLASARVTWWQVPTTLTQFDFW
ncbi:MAG: hypothetical protein GY805_31340 [Chloroflexi bacterium]|nr:hypothetical protein [Chloroflexota bacterium]